MSSRLVEGALTVVVLDATHSVTPTSTRIDGSTKTCLETPTAGARRSGRASMKSIRISRRRCPHSECDSNVRELRPRIVRHSKLLTNRGERQCLRCEHRDRTFVPTCGTACYRMRGSRRSFDRSWDSSSKRFAQGHRSLGRNLREHGRPVASAREPTCARLRDRTPSARRPSRAPVRRAQEPRRGGRELYVGLRRDRSLVARVDGLARRVAHTAGHQTLHERHAEHACVRIRAGAVWLRYGEGLSRQPEALVRLGVRACAGRQSISTRAARALAVASRLGHRMLIRRSSRSIGRLEDTEHGAHRASESFRAPRVLVHAAPNKRADARARAGLRESRGVALLLQLHPTAQLAEVWSSDTNTGDACGHLHATAHLSRDLHQGAEADRRTDQVAGVVKLNATLLPYRSQQVLGQRAPRTK